MTASLIAAVLSLFSLLALCGPPVLALRMLWLRLQWARTHGRLIYLMLSAAVVLLLLFNGLFSLGLTGPLRGLTPPLVAESPGLSAVLFAWATAGLCALLAVVAPVRRAASHI